MELIHTLGRTVDMSEFRQELNNHRYLHKPKGFLRSWVRLRVSGQTLLKLGAFIFHLPDRPLASGLKRTLLL